MMESRAMLKLLSRGRGNIVGVCGAVTVPNRHQVHGPQQRTNASLDARIAFAKLPTQVQASSLSGCRVSNMTSVAGSSMITRRWCSSKPTTEATSSTTSTAPSSTTATSSESGNTDQGTKVPPTSSLQEVNVHVVGGLPQLTVPLPSRRELCRFSLRPVTHTVNDLVCQLQLEDKGIDRVIVTTKDDVRIASSASIESLLLDDFNLIINDISYRVIVPPNHRITLEEVSDLGDVRQLVNKLYSALNVDQHQVIKEREILEEIEAIRTELTPLDTMREKLVSSAERRTMILGWCGLGYMGVQFGFLARLTWWEYSWDIMEPVTYFVTYGTAMGCYAYYVLTKTDFIYPEVRDRTFLLSFYKRANKVGLDVHRYNHLKNTLYQLESDLTRLRDPLALNLPPRKTKATTGASDVKRTSLRDE